MLFPRKENPDGLLFFTVITVYLREIIIIDYIWHKKSYVSRTW